MRSDIFSQTPAIKEILKKQSAKRGEPPNLLLVLPEYTSTEFMEAICYKFAKIHYKKKMIPRGFDKCVLLLKYPNVAGEQGRDEFFDSPRVVCKHYNAFLGTFAIEVTDYLRFADTPEFMRLVDYIQINEKGIKFILLACAREESAAEFMFSILKKRVRIDMEVIRFADAKVFSDYALELLKSSGVRYTREFEDMFVQYIVSLTQTPFFSGYEMVSRLVKDIVYKLQTQNGRRLTKDDFLRNKETCLVIDTEVTSYRRMGFFR